MNELGPGKFRTSAGNGEVQTCYFNRNKSDTFFDLFQSKRINSREHINFSIVKVNFNSFDLVNKSLDFELKNSFSKAIDTEQGQDKTTENFNNGKFSILTGRTEPRNAISLHQRRRRRREQCRTRKKPKFISGK